MLIKIKIENLKRLGCAEIELGRAVVFVGPNNSGKTTALQAIALWDLGLKTWFARHGAKPSAKERTGVTLNRRDLIALPVPNANLLWLDRHVRQGKRGNGKTPNILIRITAWGIMQDHEWEQGFEFDYANPESIYCRPIGNLDEDALERLAKLTDSLRVAFLPPMSGLASIEPKIEPGRVAVLIGEGQTAQVLRNLCASVANANPLNEAWDSIVSNLRQLFGVELLRPEFDATRGEIEMRYRSENGIDLDISSSGRGLQQTLLLLSYLYANPGAIILLDEPDAHLEILRQRQIYDRINQVALERGSQIIAATHSEIVLQQAAGRDTVIAFVGKPHRINDQAHQLRKALAEIGFEHYMYAEQQGWVLYLEGSTDLAILKTLAGRLKHAAAGVLDNAYVDFVESNTPPTARDRFYGLREAKPDLVALALFDRLERPMDLQTQPAALTEICWRRREIESYIVTRASLMAWATRDLERWDLFSKAESERRSEAMSQSIEELERALQVQGKPSPWSGDLKVSDEFLTPLFANYLRRLGLDEVAMRKKSYYELAATIPLEEIDPEVSFMLDAIVAAASRASPSVI
ncbi:MAG: AAA family ATPase [Betaproteobacteria bacterium]|nr:AAA family ATPase [Betaproteobacteria bacterium]